MRVLLDTLLFLWAMSAPSKLSARARKQIDPAEAFISAACVPGAVVTVVISLVTLRFQLKDPAYRVGM